MARKQVAAVVAVIAALVLGTLLTACASPETGGGVEYGERLDLGVPGDLVETVAGVAGYPACGTETIAHDGTTWYPFEPSNLDEFPTVAALASTGGLGGGLSRGATRIGFPAVVAPGPGDDVGTLTVYEGGFAFWRSDSGDLETWLTDRELEYWWAC
ncbi:hypothetical protein QQX13_12625 [Demequina sp. SYSU T00068]|uniref:hypothetical protein n=1 Tax=Demequina lignilytica TaxID=3051663 RepID=UPI0026198EF2|nr:hypothetical protein [Demequina sp. SYSU T00068]MDN4491679.1 hypothetical protein [Demequina sp. SYSU T00068]